MRERRAGRVVSTRLLLHAGSGYDAPQREEFPDRFEVPIAGQQVVAVAQTQLGNEAING